MCACRSIITRIRRLLSEIVLLLRQSWNLLMECRVPRYPFTVQPLFETGR
jgi:hypothetical protein